MSTDLQFHRSQRFGRWTVVDATRMSRPNQTTILVRCACGIERQVSIGSLRRGDSQSCGCLKRRIASETVRRIFTKHGEAAPGHRSAEYVIWAAMRDRCRNQKNRQWALYGGRGITICARWSDYRAFLEDVGRRPSSAHSLDRINNDGPYSPENTRWATPLQQGRNTRRNVILTYNGISCTVSEWAERLSMKPSSLFNRLFKGWSVERTLSEPLRRF